MHASPGCFLRSFRRLAIQTPIAALLFAWSSIALAASPPAAAFRLQLVGTDAVAMDNLGLKVGPAGDFNGDGYPDLVVGAPNDDTYGNNAGIAYVYFGGPGADNVPDVTLVGGANGAGVPGEQFGYSTASAGDVNGDGYDDIIVGAPSNSTAAANGGAFYIFYGGPSPDGVADKFIQFGGAGAKAGFSVAGAGDVNGDGYADIVVGAPLQPTGSGLGTVYVYLGPAFNSGFSIGNANATEQYGYSVAGAGDVNGDGYADIIAGAPYNDVGATDIGRAYISFGGKFSLTVGPILSGAAAGDLFGYSVAGAGDVNGDGFADVIVGAPLGDDASPNGGRAQIFYGGSAMNNVADVSVYGEASGEELGFTVAGLGDLNGDGFDDFGVGVPFSPVPGPGSGSVSIYLGGTAPKSVPAYTLPGSGADNENFGYSIASAGDFDGDGFPDVLVGAPFNSAVQPGSGRFYLFDFNRYHLLAPVGGESWEVGSLQNIQWLGGQPADISLSVDGGATSVRLATNQGGQNGPNAAQIVVPHLPSRFARVILTPTASGSTTFKGQDQSDAFFTISTNIALLSFKADRRADGAHLSWASDPPVSPRGISGYRLYRMSPESGAQSVRIGPELITQTSYVDPGATAGSSYRLGAVNGLGEELELGHVSAGLARSLEAWPLPYRSGVLNVSFSAQPPAGAATWAADVGIYDLSGRLVRTLARGTYGSPLQQIAWDGRDAKGSAAPAGIYFIRARSAGQVSSVKLVVLP